MIVDWPETQLHILRAGHYQWPKGAASNPDWSRWLIDYQLRFCTEGRGWIELREGRQALARGSCQWLRPGWEYRIEGDPARPLGFLTVRFDMRYGNGEKCLLSAPLPPENLAGLDANYIETEMERIVRDIVPKEDGSAFARISGTEFSGHRRMRATARLTALLMEVDEQTFRADRTPPPPVHPRVARLQKIAHRLSERPGQAPPVEELASEAGYTTAHFGRAFRKVAGSTPQAFIIFWRMQHARRLLVDTSLPVKAIALDLGYNNVEFFSHQFHQRVGRTPTAFREEHQRARAACAEMG